VLDKWFSAWLGAPLARRVGAALSQHLWLVRGAAVRMPLLLLWGTAGALVAAQAAMLVL
jgi:hypothetical protein